MYDPQFVNSHSFFMTFIHSISSEQARHSLKCCYNLHIYIYIYIYVCVRVCVYVCVSTPCVADVSALRKTHACSARPLLLHASRYDPALCFCRFPIHWPYQKLSAIFVRLHLSLSFHSMHPRSFELLEYAMSDSALQTG